MKRLLRYFIGLIIGVGALLIGAFFLFTSLAPGFISKTLSDKFKVPVLVEQINLAPSEIKITRVEIDNLPNHYLKKALTIGTIECEANLLNYLDEKIHIEEIIINNIYLGLEFDSPKGTNGNWTTLMNNLDDSETPSSEGQGKAVLIKKLVLNNIQVDVVYRSNGSSVRRLKPIPQIILYNINTDKGFPTEQIAQSVLGQVLQSVFIKENMKNMLEPQKAIENVFKPLKSLF